MEPIIRLATAHKILIATFIGFCAFFGVMQVRMYGASGSLANVGMAILSFGLAVAFGLYYRSLSGRPPEV